MSKLKPRFIVFEGIEGAGKSTLIRQLASYLLERRQDIVLSREPGGTAIADRIRSLLLHPGAEPMHSHTELCLIAASRSAHVQNVLKPAIASGKWILCDRFTDSSIAYQGYGRGLPIETIKTLNTLVCDGVKPDCVIVCDVDPLQAMGRIESRRKDRIEMESIEFFERVREGFLMLAQQTDSHIVLDSSRPQSEVFETLKMCLGIQDDHA